MTNSSTAGGTGRDARYDVLFEPVRLGPVTRPQPLLPGAALQRHGPSRPDRPCGDARRQGRGRLGGRLHRGGRDPPVVGWGRFVEGRPGTTPTSPPTNGSSNRSTRTGSLAGIELAQAGGRGATYGRIPPLGPSHLPVVHGEPVQARRMSLEDIADLRRRHRQAVARSLRAGYDLVYVYAAHGLTTVQHFLSRRYNSRDDEYGGGRKPGAAAAGDPRGHPRGGRRPGGGRLPDRGRRADRAGIERGESEELFALVGELPDVWDVMVGVWERLAHLALRRGGSREPSAVSRRSRRSRSSVSAGSPRRTRWCEVRDGVLDMIGAARPSIADPFLPRRSRRGGWRTSASASAATSASPATDDDADPLHAEPVHGRGVAARLASGAVRPRAPTRPSWSSGRAPPASRRRRRSASAGIRSCWPRRPASWAAACCARRPAGAGGLDPGGRLPRGPARAAAERRVAFESEVTADEVLAHGFGHVPSRPVPAGAPTASAAGTRGSIRARRRRAGC